jgi:hypothetical protein
LPAVLKRRDEDLEWDLIEINSGKNDAGIISAELESDALERSSAAARNQAASSGRASE